MVDLVFLLQGKHLILLAQNDCQPFPPGMKSSAFGVLTLYVILGNFCNFWVYLRMHSPRIEQLVLTRITDSVDLVFLLQDKHLILLPQHDCQPFPPIM